MPWPPPWARIPPPGSEAPPRRPGPPPPGGAPERGRRSIRSLVRSVLRPGQRPRRVDHRLKRAGQAGKHPRQRGRNVTDTEQDQVVLDALERFGHVTRRLPVLSASRRQGVSCGFGAHRQRHARHRIRPSAGSSPARNARATTAASTERMSVLFHWSMLTRTSVRVSRLGETLRVFARSPPPAPRSRRALAVPGAGASVVLFLRRLLALFLGFLGRLFLESAVLIIIHISF